MSMNGRIRTEADTYIRERLTQYNTHGNFGECRMHGSGNYAAEGKCGISPQPNGIQNLSSCRWSIPRDELHE